MRQRNPTTYCDVLTKALPGKGSEHSPLLSTCKTASGVSCPILSSSRVPQRWRRYWSTLCGREVETIVQLRWLREDLITVFSYIAEGHRKDEATFFSEVHNDRMRRMDRNYNKGNFEKTLGKQNSEGSCQNLK